MIKVITELAVLREQVEQWKQQGLRIGLVPTMGNLHPGHLSLVRLVRKHADKVIASIFVNPTQFGPNEDFGRYPRTPEADIAGLAEASCDVVWLPSVEAMYPLGLEQAVRIRVSGISEVLEGAHRPGHFDGVCTVVARLLHQAQADVAAFGRKDYQQLAVVQHMVTDLAFPTRLLTGDTVREDDGLAMSSRNQYLDNEQRQCATEIYRTLQEMCKNFQAGMKYQEVEALATAHLQTQGFVVDYTAIRYRDLTELNAQSMQSEYVALIAARLGQTRLIDNLVF